MILQKFLAVFFDHLYHSFAWCYDLVAWIVSGGRWKGWVRTVLPLIEGDRILELGSGTGTLITTLTQTGFSSFALDESRQFLRIARRSLEKSIPGTKGIFVRGKAENLPFRNASFDTVAATFPSEYLTRPESLNSCWRVLRPAGRLVVLLGVQVGGLGIYSRFLRFVYRVTGQSTPEQAVFVKIIERLRNFKFIARIETIEYRKDILTVIVAEKADSTDLGKLK